MFNVAICDDDEVFVNDIYKMLIACREELSDEMMVHKFTNPLKLKTYMSNEKIDLLYLDIEMPEINGVEIGEFIREILMDDTMSIVYVTSSEGYERKLFAVRPLEYIDKPVNKEILRKSLYKAYKCACKGGRLYHYNQKYERKTIPIDKILYFQANKKKVEMVTDTNIIVINSTIRKIKDELSKEPFIQANQSVLINVSGVKCFEGDRITMIDKSVHYISKDKLKDVRLKYSRLKMEELRNASF